MSTSLTALLDAAVNTSGMESLGIALALLLLGVGLLVLEIFVVSFGLLMLASAASILGAIYFAFRYGTLVGWLLVIAAAVLVSVFLRWGLARIRRSRMVPSYQPSSNLAAFVPDSSIELRSGISGRDNVGSADAVMCASPVNGY